MRTRYREMLDLCFPLRGQAPHHGNDEIDISLQLKDVIRGADFRDEYHVWGHRNKNGSINVSMCCLACTYLFPSFL